MIHTSGNRSRMVTGFIIFLGALGAVFIPTIIIPFINPDPFREMQSEGRKNIRKEDIQPGNMNIWRDPFERKPNENKQK